MLHYPYSRTYSPLQYQRTGWHVAGDAEELPLMQWLVPDRVLKNAGQVDVVGGVTRTQLPREYEIRINISRTRSSPVGWTDVLPIKFWGSVLASVFTSSPTATQKHGTTRTASGKPCRYLLIWQ